VIATLIETRRPVAWGGAFGGQALSVVIHSSLIAAALYATLHARKAVLVDRPIIAIEMPRQTAPPPPPAAAPSYVSLTFRFNTLAIPTSIPTQIPPPSQVAFDPTSFAGLGVESARPWGRDTATGRAVVRPEAVYAVEVLEERPVRIGGPEPAYPDLLRRARIEGQVTVECVVDTTGRTEPGSVRIVSSTHRLFEQPAREAAAGWLFQPGRIDGRAVRVRVRIPLNFVM
jgi:TonB family protein